MSNVTPPPVPGAVVPLLGIGGWCLQAGFLGVAARFFDSCDTAMAQVQIRRVALTDPDAQLLVAEVQAEYVTRYGGPDDTPLDTTMFDAPSGAFFVAYVDDVPAAMGGWRLRPDVVRLGGRLSAEIKRMYVAPSGRRRGLARAVLAHLEETARAAGADVMVLETGTAQPEAIALYESSGYEPVEKFGHYSWSPKSRCYGKRLVQQD